MGVEFIPTKFYHNLVFGGKLQYRTQLASHPGVI